MIILSNYQKSVHQVHLHKLPVYRSLTFKLQDGKRHEFGKTKTKEKQVKIGSSLGFTVYIGSGGISLDIKTSLVEEEGKKNCHAGWRCSVGTDIFPVIR